MTQKAEQDQIISFQPYMNYIVLTGSPSSWKTTLISALQKMWFPVVPESAMEIIWQKKEELWWIDAWKNWIRDESGNIRKSHFREFIESCLDLQIEKEWSIPHTEKPVFLDRGTIDYFSFAELRWVEMSDTQRLKLEQHNVRLWSPTKVFNIELIPENFENRGETWRVITLEEAQRFNRINQSLYPDSLIHIPHWSIESRVDQILGFL